MKTYLKDAEEELISGQTDPENLLSTGQSPVNEDLNRNTLFKFTMLTSIILNMEETIIKS
jgi:hypothetical protein